MILPRTDEHNQPYVSYSQIKLWNEAKGFNTGKLGREEFIRSYFLGEDYPERGGFATFGTQVENYITERKDADKFTDAERAVLETITPLGVYQRETRIPFGGFYLKSYVDDSNLDFSHIRDYKTASRASGKKYEEDDYWQLDVYALGAEVETGRLPTKLEVCVIERTGNGFKGGRDVLKVGQDVWYIQRQTSLERLKKLEQTILSTTKEISEYYEIFLELNK